MNIEASYKPLFSNGTCTIAMIHLDLPKTHTALHTTIHIHNQFKPLTWLHSIESTPKLCSLSPELSLLSFLYQLYTHIPSSKTHTSCSQDTLYPKYTLHTQVRGKPTHIQYPYWYTHIQNSKKHIKRGWRWSSASFLCRGPTRSLSTFCHVAAKAAMAYRRPAPGFFNVGPMSLGGGQIFSVAWAFLFCP